MEALDAGYALKWQLQLQRLLGSFVSVRASAAEAHPKDFYGDFVMQVLQSLGSRVEDV
ncbi:MAG: hypothetical protein PUI29_04060 [Aeromonadales bacterium]|nr:hypothetical protein [Aeromonadales bacterium]MDY2890692.1 hypothetical protein [Succinivibrio sp.]